MCLHAGGVAVLLFAGLTPRPTPGDFGNYRRVTLVVLAAPAERSLAPPRPARKRKPPLTAAFALIRTPAPQVRRAFAAPQPPLVIARPVAEVSSAPPLEVPNNLPAALRASLPTLPPPPLKTGNLSSFTLASAVAPASALVQATGFIGVQTATRDAPPARPGMQTSGSFATVSTSRAPVADVSITQGGFQDAAFTPSSTAVPPGSSSALPLASAIEILFKPRPIYTAEARRLQIEGEVLVELLFAASGEARVRRVIRGLGHGLDETAVDAARAIRFRPASRNGVPMDFAAVVHIIFQLAY